MADQGNEGLLSPFLRSERFKAAKPYIRGRVLDVGCGSGTIASMVPATHYLGVDIDEQSLLIARKQYPEHRFQNNLPSVESLFDTVVALAVIEHVNKPNLFLDDLAARLKPDPKSLIICTSPHPNFNWIHKIGAAAGLFSSHGSKEHKELLDMSRLEEIAEKCGLKLALYKLFLLKANQLVIFQRADIKLQENEIR